MNDVVNVEVFESRCYLSHESLCDRFLKTALFFEEPS